MNINKKLILSLAVVVLVAAGCNQTATPQPTPSQPQPQTQVQPSPSPSPAAPVSAAHAVMIQNFVFSVSALTIKKGETVVWTNQDAMAHTVTGDSAGPNSPDLATNQTYSYTFDTVGTFNYHCALHPSMKGVVIVTP